MLFRSPSDCKRAFVDGQYLKNVKGKKNTQMGNRRSRRGPPRLTSEVGPESESEGAGMGGGGGFLDFFSGCSSTPSSELLPLPLLPPPPRAALFSLSFFLWSSSSFSRSRSRRSSSASSFFRRSSSSRRRSSSRFFHSLMRSGSLSLRGGGNHACGQNTRTASAVVRLVGLLVLGQDRKSTRLNSSH